MDTLSIYQTLKTAKIDQKHSSFLLNEEKSRHIVDNLSAFLGLFDRRKKGIRSESLMVYGGA